MESEMSECKKRIEARAKALGWDYIRRDKSGAPMFPSWSDYALLPCGFGEGALHFFMDKHPEPAERLLSLYEDGLDSSSAEYEDYWKPLLQTDGKWDADKIKAEMTDLIFVLNQTAEVYDYITGGKLSNIMLYAKEIKTAFDDAVSEAAEEMLRDKE